jgi:microcystin-dependent protein
MPLKLSNNATSTLAASIDTDDTVISVTQGSLFPALNAGEWFMATIVDDDGNREIVKCTARVSNTLTVVRAQEGTTARSFTSGVVVEHRLTAGSFDIFAQKDADNTFSGDDVFTGDLSFEPADGSGTHDYVMGSGGDFLLRFFVLNTLGWVWDVSPSEFKLARYSNAGAFQDNPFKVNRTTGVVTVPNLVVGTNTVDSFASGTRMLFQQTTAPVGWTKITDYNDYTLRVVSGSVGTGGSTNFSTVFASRAVTGTVGDTTLTVNQIPAHRHHVFASVTATSTTPVVGASTQACVVGSFGSNNSYVNVGTSTDATVGRTSEVGGGQAHTHSLTMNNLDMAVQYVDVIVAQKD